MRNLDENAIRGVDRPGQVGALATDLPFVHSNMNYPMSWTTYKISYKWSMAHHSLVFVMMSNIISPSHHMTPNTLTPLF